MNEADFFREVLTIVEAEFSDTQWTLVPDDGVLLTDEEIQYGLRNLLAEAQFHQWSAELLKQSLIQHFRKIIPAMHEDLEHLDAETAMAALYPMLSIPGRTPELDLFEDLAGLRKCLVVDRENTFKYVTADLLKIWGLSPTEACRIAAENLTATSHDIPMEIMEDWPGKPLLFSCGDGYDATRITLPVCRQQIADRLGETFWIAIPSRVDLLACRANISKRTHRLLQERVESIFDQLPYPLSPQVYYADVDSFPKAALVRKPWWQKRI